MHRDARKGLLCTSCAHGRDKHTADRLAVAESDAIRPHGVCELHAGPVCPVLVPSTRATHASRLYPKALCNRGCTGLCVDALQTRSSRSLSRGDWQRDDAAEQHTRRPHGRLGWTQLPSLLICGPTGATSAYNCATYGYCCFGVLCYPLTMHLGVTTASLPEPTRTQRQASWRCLGPRTPEQLIIGQQHTHTPACALGLVTRTGHSLAYMASAAASAPAAASAAPHARAALSVVAGGAPPPVVELEEPAGIMALAGPAAGAAATPSGQKSACAQHDHVDCMRA